MYKQGVHQNRQGVLGGGPSPIRIHLRKNLFFTPHIASSHHLILLSNSQSEWNCTAHTWCTWYIVHLGNEMVRSCAIAFFTSKMYNPSLLRCFASSVQGCDTPSEWNGVEANDSEFEKSCMWKCKEKNELPAKLAKVVKRRRRRKADKMHMEVYCK